MARLEAVRSRSAQPCLVLPPRKQEGSKENQPSNESCGVQQLRRPGRVNYLKLKINY